MTESSPNPPAKRNNAGSIYLIFLGLFLMLLGGLFTLLMWAGFQRANHTRSWDQHPAVITQSEKETRQIAGHNQEFRWLVSYDYTIDGKSYSSNKYTPRGAKWRKRTDDVDELLVEFPVGTQVTCYVDPKLATSAILKHDSRGAGYSIWFPMLFAVGGGGMIIGAIRKWNK